MKNTILIFCLTGIILASGSRTNAQEIRPSLKFTTKVNTVGTPFIEISIVPEILKSDITAINSIKTIDLKNGNKDLLNDNSKAKITIRYARKSVKIKLDQLTLDELSKLENGLKTARLVLDNDLEISLKNGTTLFYTMDELSELSEGKLLLSEKQKKDYINASGGAYAFMKNRFELGLVPKETSENETTNILLDFSYRKSYGFIKDSKAYFTVEGLVSSNSNDSTTFINVYPISYKLTDTEKLSELVIEAGIEGTQNYNYWRVSGNLKYRLLFENFVNLSDGNNRLRLKPVLSLGLKIYSEQDNTRVGDKSNNETSGQINADIYYVIPVFDVFTIIADAGVFYDLNKSVNPDEEFQFNYRISFGYEIKKQGFQTLISYRNGVTDVNYEDRDFISIGIFAQLSK